MTPLLALAMTATLTVTWDTPTPAAHVDGMATYYAPGLLARVAAYRGVDTSAHAGIVALNRAGDLGRTVWLQWADGAAEGPFLSVDCARRGDYALRLQQNRVVEVDATVARQRGFYGVGPVPVRVWFLPDQPPALPTRTGGLAPH